MIKIPHLFQKDTRGQISQIKMKFSCYSIILLDISFKYDLLELPSTLTINKDAFLIGTPVSHFALLGLTS